MAPTRRSTRAKSTDQGVAGLSPPTKATRARPATKTNPPAAKPRTKPTRKTVSKSQTVVETEEKEVEKEVEEEEEVQEEVQEELKPRAKITRRGAAKTHTVPTVEKEEEEGKEIVSQEEIEDIVAAATRRSNLATAIASLQSPTKSKASRGRVAKKVAPARKTRAFVEDEEAVADTEAEDVVVPIKSSQGRKPLVEAANSPAPAEIIEAVIAKSRPGRGDAKKSKNPIGELVVAESSLDGSATPSWAKKRGGRKAKVLEDETPDANAVQRTEGETEVVGVDDVKDVGAKDVEPELVVAKGKGRKKTVLVESGTTIEIAEPEPIPKGRGGRKGKKVDAVAGAAAEDTAVVAGVEPVLKGKSKKGKKVDVVPQEPEAVIEDTVSVAELELAPKGRASRRGKKVDVVPQEPEAVIEDTVSIAEPEPAAKGRASKRSKKVDVVPQEPEAIIEDTVSVAKPELALKGRASRRSKKVDSVPDNIEVNPEPAVAKEKKGKKVVEDTKPVVGEPVSVVEEPRPVPAKGGGRRGGRKVDTVVEEPEPVLAGGRGRKRDKQAVQDAEIMDTSVNQQTAAETENGVGGADAVVGDIEATSQETQIVGDTEVEVVGEPVVKSKGRKGKKAAPAKKSTRKGRKVAVELPDVEMSDTDVQTQETEVDVEAEPITITGPTVKDSGVFLEEEPIIEEPSVDKLEPIAEGSDAAVEESVIITEAEIKIASQDSNAVAEQEEELIVTMRSEATVEVGVITAQPVAVESNTGQTRAITEETEVEVPEPLKLFAKSPGSSKKKTPKGKGKAKIVLPVEQDVEIGEPAVKGENSGPNIEFESAILKSSIDIEMLGSDIGIEQETAHARKFRKKVKKSATTIKKERQVKAAAAKKSKGVATDNTVGVEAQDIVSDIFFDGVPPKNAEAGRIGNEGVMIGGKRLVEVDEEDEPDLPLPFSSPVVRPTLILSPRRTTPDPDLDPIKTPVPSSPIDRLMSHPLGSSPLRQNNPDSVVLASPRLVTTPSNSPSKKRSTPNTRTPINRLSGSGIPFGRNLEDSRDVRSISTPARGRNSSVASSPIMMPPATPNVVAGDARSPTKQTPTRESEIVRDMLDRVDEPSMLVGSITNINSSPVKNSTPIRPASGFEKSSPVGRLSVGGSEISQSSPLVGRLQINDPNLLLSSPLAVPLKTFSPTKAQHSSPTRSSPLKHSPLAMGSSGFFGDETVETSFTSFDGYYNHIGEPDDDEEGEEDYQDQETEYGEGEEVEEKSDQQQKIPSTIEYENEDDSVDFDATIDESRLFKLAEKAKLEGDAQAEPDVEEQQEENEEGKEKETEVVTGMLGHNILTSRVSDFEVSCLEQVHPEFGQMETHVGNVFAGEVANSNEKEEADIGEGGEQSEGEGVGEGNLMFSDVVGGEDSIPSSPILEITSPIKFDYRPTSEIFPSGEFREASQEGPFSPIDMDFFTDRSFDTSAADWKDDEDDEEDEDEEEEDEETELDVNSPGGRLKHFRASSPPNIWPTDEECGEQSVDSPAPMPWENSGFDFSEEFIRPPSESPEPGDEVSFDFSKNIPSPNSPTPEEFADNTEEVSPLPIAKGQVLSPAVRGIPPVDFQAGGASVRPVVGPRESKAMADTWLGKKGLRPKEEKQSAPEESANNESEEGGKGEIEGGGDGAVEMKGVKRARAVEKSVERIKKAKRNSGNGAKVEATVEKGRRQTFGGKPMARLASPLKRRKSFPEGPTIPDRQSYLYASDPKRILRHWAKHEKDQLTPQSIAPSSPLLSVAANSIEAGLSSNILPKSLVRPSPTTVRPRRIRSVSGAAASFLSGPHSSPPSTGGKRKAAESLETERASKSSIPVSRRLARPVNNKTQEEVDLVLKNTAHNALYSCKLDYEPVRKRGKRPPSLDHNGVQRLATEARRKRKEAEESGLVLRPGEDEAFVAAGEKDGNKRIKWDAQLVYDFEGGLSEGSHARPDSLPNKSILAAKPRLNLHGNWVPTPGVPPLKIPEELIIVKKIMYQGEGEPVKKGRK